MQLNQFIPQQDNINCIKKSNIKVISVQKLIDLIS